MLECQNELQRIDINHRGNLLLRASIVYVSLDYLDRLQRTHIGRKGILYLHALFPYVTLGMRL